MMWSCPGVATVPSGGNRIYSASFKGEHTMRILMVLPVDDGSRTPKVWAKRQIDSLHRLGIATDEYLFENRRSLKGLIAGGRALRAKARSCHADFVHVHYGAAQALVAVLCSPKPVVISFCGSDIFGNYGADGRRTWSGVLSGVLSQLAAIGCRRCIAKSEELKQALWFSWSRNKCDVIPNGVDLTTFRPMPRDQARHALGWHHDDPVVLFMDRKGAWVKDPALAQAACAHATRSVAALRMHVIENEAPEKVPLFFNAADVLLLTSRHEGSNNTVKEALACNLPVVATACGDVAERLKGVRACHVCSRDASELGGRLSEILLSRQRSDGREHIKSLTLDRVAIRVKQCYEKARAHRAWRWLPAVPQSDHPSSPPLDPSKRV
jgi:glycosyltransferase involved in cell wall biosynthesis